MIYLPEFSGAFAAAERERYEAPPWVEPEPERTPFEEGRWAAESCENIDDNPYKPKFADERREWERGFVEAFHETE